MGTFLMGYLGLDWRVALMILAGVGILFAILFLALFWLFLIWSPVVPALSVLNEIALWTRSDDFPVGVHTLPKKLDEKVAALHLAKVGANLTRLSKEQADYIGVPTTGPFKGDPGTGHW